MSSEWIKGFGRVSRVASSAAETVEERLSLVIEEEKSAGKLPASFTMKEILLERFAKEAAASVDQRFGSGCE